MKVNPKITLFSSFIVILLFVYSLTLHAQNNVAKLGLQGLGLGKLNLSYELVTNDKQSVVLNGGFLIPRKMPVLLTSSADIIGETKMNGFSLVPEYRFYSGKKGAPVGFYWAPYLSFSNYSLKFSDTYHDSEVSVKAGIYTFGAGIQMGMQWIISDWFTIDWTILGIDISKYSGYAEIRAKNSVVDFPQMEQDIHDEVDGFPIIGSRLKTSSGADYLNADLPIVFLGMRSSFSIGIAF